VSTSNSTIPLKKQRSIVPTNDHLRSPLSLPIGFPGFLAPARGFDNVEPERKASEAHGGTGEEAGLHSRAYRTSFTRNDVNGT
jgi:hypothetical protein